MHYEGLPHALPGDVVGINVKNVSLRDVSRGCFVCGKDAPIHPVAEFEAQLICLNHPTGIREGFQGTFLV